MENKGECPPEFLPRYETLLEVFNRVNEVLKLYLSYKKIIVVTHGIVIRQFAYSKDVPNCDVRKIEYGMDFQWAGFIG